MHESHVELPEPVVEEASQQVPCIAKYQRYVDVVCGFGDVSQVSLLAQVGRHLQQDRNHTSYLRYEIVCAWDYLNMHRTILSTHA